MLRNDRNRNSLLRKGPSLEVKNEMKKTEMKKGKRPHERYSNEVKYRAKR